jgi:type I restriction enzyme R subunit
LLEHPTAVGLLDGVSGHDPTVVLYEGDDRWWRCGRTSTASTPSDYLEAFGAFIEANMNRIPALTVVKTAPSDLTRKQLKELAEALEPRGLLRDQPPHRVATA